MGHDLGSAYHTVPWYDITVPILSKFTTSILKDTGYYEDIDESLTSPTLFGKGKGCRFLKKGDCDFKN